MEVHDSKCPELPAPPRRIAVFAIVSLMLGVGLAYLLRHPQRPQCVGVVAVRSTVVSAGLQGTLAEFAVEEGDAVQIGTPLARLLDTELQRDIALKQEEIAAHEQQLQQAQAHARLELEWRLRELNAEICEIELRSAGFLKEKYDYELKRNYYADLISGNQLALLGDGVALDALLSQGRFSQAERLTAVMHMEAAANAAEVSAAQVEICEQQMRRLKELKKKLPEDVQRSTTVAAAAARLKQAQAELEQLQGRVKELTVRSPAIGTVGVFKVRPGDVVDRGTELVELLDPSQQHLVAHVPSQEIGAFGEGTEVLLSFPGRAMRTGRVANVAPQAGTSENTLSGEDVAVLVQIEPTGRVWPEVPVGSHVTVFSCR